MNKASRVLIAALGMLAAIVATADDDLPKSRAEALAMEAKDALPLTSFYDPPQSLGGRTPGALIRSAPFHGYSLPAGAHAVRVLYVSRALDGSPVAASEVVLIPAGTPPRRGWPFIAWAHGTSGVARMCAPSLMKERRVRQRRSDAHGGGGLRRRRDGLCRSRDTRPSSV